MAGRFPEVKGGLPVAALLAACCVPAAVSAQDTDWNRYTLEDLGGVFVRIEANDVCAAIGVTPAAYEADVSLRLIEAEVGVLTREEMLTHQAMPELRINLDCIAGSNGAEGSVAYSVGLRVQQAAQMLRDSQITLPEAVTWYTTRLGVSGEGEVAEAVQNTLMATVDEFSKAWAAAHAEEGSL
jgi:hypothetical protein